MIVEFKVLVRESHLDTFGHMNNTTYMELFEEARWDLITSRGYGLDKIRETKLGPVILEANLRYKREVLLRETITVTCELIEYNSKIGKMRQFIKKENGDIACEAMFHFGLFDTVNRKLVSPTPDWLYAIGHG